MPSPLRTRPLRPAEPDRTPALDALSDQTLLVRFAASDPEAAAVFVRRFQRRVFGVAFTILRDARAAEDAAQEAFLRAWRHAAVFDPRRGSVVTWLLTITRNSAIDASRARHPVALDPTQLQRLSPEAAERDTAVTAVMNDDILRLRKALSELPDEQRRAVVLAGVWGLSGREIAAREQIPLGTAKSRIRIALRRLHVTLARDGREQQQVCT
jgi:RNA polymerase sigma-70 factor (ECF subfamily)